MSFVQPSALHVIADSVGIPKLSADAAKVLAPDVEYRIREIIQEAVKFKRHSKRSELSTDDISHALRLRNVQPVYGFSSSNKDAARFLRAAGHSDLWFVEDREAPFQQVIGKSLPRAPLEVGLLPHWLVVDGVQPAIPENAPLERPRARKRPRSGTAAAGSAAAAAVQNATAPRQAAGEEAADGSVVRVPVKHVLSQELQLYFDKVSEVLLNGGEAAVGGTDALSDSQAGAQAAGSGAERLERAVLASLSSDPGLADLVPYLVQLVAEGVGGGLKDLGRLQRLVAASAALLANQYLDLTKYLQLLLPAVLTCLVARRLGDAATADHWALRDAAARLVRTICLRFADPLHNIQPRISKTLVKALLDRSKPVTTHYGAIVGLAALGPRTVRLLLLPHLADYLAHLQPLLGSQEGDGGSATTAKDEVQRAEALRCFGALRTAAAGAVYGGIAERLADHLLLAQPTSTAQEPSAAADTQPTGDQAAGADSMRQPGSAAETPTGTAAVKMEQPDDTDREADGVEGGPDQPDLKSKATARRFTAVHQPVSAVKRGNPHLGLLDRRKRKRGQADVNVLADAWKEDSDLGAQLQVVADLFGESVLPWVPFQAGVGLFL